MATLTTKYDVGDIIYVLCFNKEKVGNTNNSKFFDNNFAKIFRVQIINVYVSKNSKTKYEVEYGVADEDNEEETWNEAFEERLCFKSLSEATMVLLNKWFPNNGTSAFEN